VGKDPLNDLRFGSFVLDGKGQKEGKDEGQHGSYCFLANGQGRKGSLPGDIIRNFH
jgi:hypothetical protein